MHLFNDLFTLLHDFGYAVGIKWKFYFLLLYPHTSPLGQNGRHKNYCRIRQPPLEAPRKFLIVNPNCEHVQNENSQCEVQALICFLDNKRIWNYHEHNIPKVGQMCGERIILRDV